ncbi:Cation/H(+) antiporter 15 [Linum perenne]
MDAPLRYTRKSGQPMANLTLAQLDCIINAFENYEHHETRFVAFQPLTAISPYPAMHEDICNLAEDKRVAIRIVLFHKQQTVDGGMEAMNPAFRLVNQNVLSHTPCSVGVLVDRALPYAWRMSEHPVMFVTVMQFIVREGVVRSELNLTALKVETGTGSGTARTRRKVGTSE